jgi:hypothetical protein
MASGERRLRVPVRLVAVAAMLLATGGIVTAISTGEVDSVGTDGTAAGCRHHLVTDQDRVQGSDGGRAGCTSDTQPVFDKDPGDKDRAGIVDDAVVFPGRVEAGGPFPGDFVPIELIAPEVERARLGSARSIGSFSSPCGTNVEGHRNSDNFMVVPGKVNGAQHIHDYVGNLSTNAFSTDESLAAADTTCTNDDKSTYFWPVLRNTRVKGIDAKADGGGRDGNVGEILRPARAQLQFRGNPTGKHSGR